MRDEYRCHELARLHEIISGLATPATIYPLANMRIIKDLVFDLTHVFAQYRLVEPWLRSKTAEPEKERLVGCFALAVVGIFATMRITFRA